jgi:hypothetical protein
MWRAVRGPNAAPALTAPLVRRSPAGRSTGCDSPVITDSCSVAASRHLRHHPAGTPWRNTLAAGPVWTDDPGTLGLVDGQPAGAICLDFDGERITGVRMQGNPDKLRGLTH